MSRALCLDVHEYRVVVVVFSFSLFFSPQSTPFYLFSFLFSLHVPSSSQRSRPERAFTAWDLCARRTATHSAAALCPLVHGCRCFRGVFLPQCGYLLVFFRVEVPLVSSTRPLLTWPQSSPISCLRISASTIVDDCT